MGGGRRGDMEKENLLLTFEGAEEPAAGQRFPVRREAHVMRLIPSGAGPGKRHAGDHLPVFRRMLVEIDHREKVGIRARLVAGPDEQMFLFARFLFALASS